MTTEKIAIESELQGALSFLEPRSAWQWQWQLARETESTERERNMSLDRLTNLQCGASLRRREVKQGGQARVAGRCGDEAERAVQERPLLAVRR